MTVDKLTKRDLPAMALLPRTPICTLRFLGTDEPTIDLPLAQQRFFVGAGPASDVIVPRHLSAAVSACHASLERSRSGNGFIVRDLGSKNGTFSTLAGPRHDVFEVEPGATFWLANVPVVVTDLTLDVLRAHLIVHLGVLAHEAVEQAMRDVASGDPLLLLGPAGTGARRLAAYVHTTSAQRGIRASSGCRRSACCPSRRGRRSTSTSTSCGRCRRATSRPSSIRRAASA